MNTNNTHAHVPTHTHIYKSKRGKKGEVHIIVTLLEKHYVITWPGRFTVQPAQKGNDLSWSFFEILSNTNIVTFIPPSTALNPFCCGHMLTFSKWKHAPSSECSAVITEPTRWGTVFPSPSSTHTCACAHTCSQMFFSPLFPSAVLCFSTF